MPEWYIRSGLNILRIYILPFLFLVAGIFFGIRINERRKVLFLRGMAVFEIFVFLFFLLVMTLIWPGIALDIGSILVLVFLVLVNASNWWPKTRMLTFLSALLSSAALIGWGLFFTVIIFGIGHGLNWIDTYTPIRLVYSALEYCLIFIYALKSTVLFTEAKKQWTLAKSPTFRDYSKRALKRRFFEL